MGKTNPSRLGEHEGNTLGFDEVLIPDTRQQVVDQGGDVADVHAAVAVHVTALAASLLVEVARVARTTIDVGIIGSRMGGIIGRALATHKARTASKRT